MGQRIAVACGLAAVLAGSAAGQNQSSTWANDLNHTAWGDTAAWTNSLVPSGTGTATFPSAASPVSPLIEAATTRTIASTVFTNNGAGASYSILAGDASSVLALTSTANTNGASALNVTGVGTTTVNPTLRLTSGAFVYATGGSTLVITNPLTTATAGGGINFRVGGGTSSTGTPPNVPVSTLRLLGTSAITGTVGIAVGTDSGGAGGRFELGADNPFGTGPLTTGAGNAGQFQVIPIDPNGVNGVTRTLGNSSYTVFNSATAPSSIFFGDTAGTTAAVANNTNSLVITGSATLRAAGTPAPVNVLLNNGTTPVVSTAALRFGGTVALRLSSDTSSSAEFVQFQNTGRVEIAGAVSNGGGAGAGQSGIVVGTGGGTTTLRLASGASTYTGTTTLQSGGLILAADAPATGTGSLGNPTSGSETVTVGVASTSTTVGSTDRYLLLDVAGGNVTLGRPVSVVASAFVNSTTGSPAPPTTFLGAIGAGANVATYSGTVNLGTTNATPTLPLILNAQNAGSTTQLNGSLQRASGFTGPINVQVNTTLGGYGGTGTVAVGGTQPTTGATAPNAQVSVTGGTFRVDTSFDAGRGLYVGGGTAVINGTLAASTAGGVLSVGQLSPSSFNPSAFTNAGTLAGTGTTTLPVTVNAGATVAPGPAGGVGTLSTPQGATLASSAVWSVNLTAVAPNTPATADTTSASQLALGNTAGALNLQGTSGGPLTVNLALTGGTFTPYQPVSYAIASAASSTQFQVNGNPFTYDPTQYTFTAGFGFDPSSVSLSTQAIASTNYLVLTFTPVPEPATGLAVAAAGGGRLRRRGGGVV